MSNKKVRKDVDIKKEMMMKSSDADTLTSTEPMKVCKGCGRSLPLSAFGLHRLSKDGYMAECKECRRRRSAVKNAEGDPLAKFTARELIHELSKRGYRGELTYTEIKVHKMSLKDF